MADRELTKDDTDTAWHLFNVARGKEQLAKVGLASFQDAKGKAGADFNTAENRARANYDKAIAAAQGKLDDAVAEAKVELNKVDGDAETARQTLADHQATLLAEVGYEAQLPAAGGGTRVSV